MTGWADLARELDAWSAAGRPAEFWWRDDDATQPTPALDRLISMQRKHQVSLALAVIPAPASAALAQRLAAEPGIAVVQHGWTHMNHAAPGRPKAELGADRAPAYVLGELTRGAFRLDQLFGQNWLRVLVPPHNRIAADIAAGLAADGYAGLSTDRARRAALPGLVQANTHIDIMDWASRAFLGETACLDLAIAHLAAKRHGTADPDEPTGLLTHHLAHDEAAWAFADNFIGQVRGHRAARWLEPRAIFQPGAASRSPRYGTA